MSQLTLFGHADCPHDRRRLAKGYCVNGAVQVREVCEECDVNVRGAGRNVPHSEAGDLDALPTLFDHRPGNTLPAARPATVHGVALNTAEAGIFEEAVAAGELVVGLDMPLSSPVPLAWERWCRERGRECLVREVRA